jgi:hypothetical protein
MSPMAVTRCRVGAEYKMAVDDRHSTRSRTNPVLGTGNGEFQGPIGNFRCACPRVSYALDAVLRWDVST